MSASWAMGLGALAGMLTSGVHLWFLWRHIRSAQGRTPWGARLFIIRRMVWRLALWLPGIYLVVRLGLWACLAFGLGALAMRWSILWRLGRT